MLQNCIPVVEIFLSEIRGAVTRTAVPRPYRSYVFSSKKKGIEMKKLLMIFFVAIVVTTFSAKSFAGNTWCTGTLTDV